MKPYDNPDIAYLMNVLIIYDGDDKSVSSGDLLFAVHQALNTYRAGATSGNWDPDKLRSCKQMALEIERLPYPKSRMLKALL
jgi:hypothetical protein